MKQREKEHPATALDVLQGLLEKGNSPLSQDFKRYRLKLDWGEVVGPTLASKCSPVGFSGGILYVWVMSASWMHQLTFVKKELVNKVNQYAGAKWIKDIRFTQDRREIS